MAHLSIAELARFLEKRLKKTIQKYIKNRDFPDFPVDKPSDLIIFTLTGEA